MDTAPQSTFQASRYASRFPQGRGGPRQRSEDSAFNLRSYALAVFVHILLLAALAWGVNWKRDHSLAVEAELWSTVPQEVAPQAEPAPEPQPQPAPEPEPAPEPKPEPVPPPPPPTAQAPTQAQQDADINLEREREQKAKAQAEADRKARLLREQEQKERDRKLAEDKRRKEEAERKAAAEKAAAEQREQLRQENLRRMAGLADAAPQPNAAGQALRTSGPSATYAGRIRGRIMPNIVFTEAANLDTNPSAEVEVHCSADGVITSRKLTKSSGIPLWDDAVLKAIDKTAILPKDTDGSVPPVMVLTFRPKDR